MSAGWCRMEVVVRFPAKNSCGRPTRLSTLGSDARSISYLERLEFVWQIQQTIDPRVGPERAAIWLGRRCRPSHLPHRCRPAAAIQWSLARRSAPTPRWKQVKASSNSGYLTTDNDDGTELWRISLGAAAFEDLDYGEFVQDVRVGDRTGALRTATARDPYCSKFFSSREDQAIAGLGLSVGRNVPMQAGGRRGRLTLNAARLSATRSTRNLPRSC